MTWRCPNCGRSHIDSDIGVPYTADADTKLACLECIEDESPSVGRNGTELVVGLIDHTERTDDNRPQRYWSKYAISLPEMARMDDRDFWEMATEQMAANIIATYREDADEAQL